MGAVLLIQDGKNEELLRKFLFQDAGGKPFPYVPICFYEVQANVYNCAASGWCQG
jgi:hypothetical protein